MFRDRRVSEQETKISELEKRIKSLEGALSKRAETVYEAIGLGNKLHHIQSIYDQFDRLKNFLEIEEIITPSKTEFRKKQKKK